MQFTVILSVLFGFTCIESLGICSVKHCTDPARCRLSQDQKSCKCTRGFYADWCDKDAKIKVMCGKNFITISVLEDYFQYYNVPLETLHLPNKSCRAQREEINGVGFYVARISKDKYTFCGGKPLEKNITHISYSLSLKSSPDDIGNIIREPMIKIEYTCIYPYIRTVSLPFPVIPFSSETVMRVDELDAKVQMMLFTNRSYTKAYSSAPTIELRDKVYVEVKVTEPEDFFLLQVSECWATQSPQPKSKEGSVHTLLLNGCVSDETVAFLNPNTTLGQAGRNGESSTVRYMFDMFRFVAEPHDFYLHCSVQLCEPDDGESCTPNCKSISKRSAVRADPAQGLLSYGPIRIEVPDRSQSSILTTVVIPVAAIWMLGLFLLILITVAKAGARRLGQIKC